MSSTSSQIFWKSTDPEATLLAALEQANAPLHELSSQQWDPNTATIGGIRDYRLCFLAPDADAWSSLLLHLNSQLADPLAASLSTATSSPTVAFYEFDQCAWGFTVYDNGQAVARFWNRPEVVEEDPSACTVDPISIAGKFGVGVEAAAPYLKHLDADAEQPDKALPADEFSLGDHWVRCDFMRRLGLRYRNPGEPGTRHVFIKERGIN
jgi:hypothetical protein